MKKLFFIFLLVAVLGSSFFLFPAVSADTVSVDTVSADSASSKSSNTVLTWKERFPIKVDTTGLTSGGNAYTLTLDTSLPFGADFKYILNMVYYVGIDGDYSAFRTSYIINFFGGASGTYTVDLPVSYFPSGYADLDSYGSVSFGIHMSPSDKSGNLSIVFDLFHAGSGYPATVGDILFTIRTDNLATVYGLYYNYQTSGITSSTDFYIPVCYWKVTVGSDINTVSAIHINQSTEWYTQMVVSASDNLGSLEVFNSSGELVSEASWTVPSDYESYFVFVYYDVTYPFLDDFAQRKFWDAVSSAKYSAGLTTGQNDGFNQGYNVGKDDGYKQGFDAGLAEGTPTSALAGIISGVSNILGIPLFGDFTLGGLISIIIGIGLLFLFLKIFAGG